MYPPLRLLSWQTLSSPSVKLKAKGEGSEYKVQSQSEQDFQLDSHSQRLKTDQEESGWDKNLFQFLECSLLKIAQLTIFIINGCRWRVSGRAALHQACKTSGQHCRRWVFSSATVDKLEKAYNFQELHITFISYVWKNNTRWTFLHSRKAYRKQTLVSTIAWKAGTPVLAELIVIFAERTRRKSSSSFRGSPEEEES